ncbi:MAG: sensor histidine kinase [Gemmatimonadales bacterium]|nr:MAG: sensor histidine kinase [Gemmatimonadales bacterium]
MAGGRVIVSTPGASEDDALPHLGERTVEKQKTKELTLVRGWMEARGREGQLLPMPEVVQDRVILLLETLQGWVSSGEREVGEDFRLACRDLASCFRSHGFDVRDTLDELGHVEDLLLGDAPYPNGEPPVSLRLRRAMRVLVEETVRLNHVLDARRSRENADALETFGEILAHELGNRLGAARTGVDLLQNPPDGLGKERHVEIIALVAAGIDAALNTVDDVAAFMDAQQWSEGDPVPLPQVVTRVVLGIRPVARRKGVQLEIREPLPPVEVEGGRMRLVLSNLLVNGVRYADASKSERWVRLGASCADGQLRIEVQDNGIGIHEADHDRVFRYHERGGDGPEHPRGSGLGLTIVREAVIQLGGETRLVSEPGSGSTFEIRLPMAAPGSPPVSDA